MKFMCFIVIVAIFLFTFLDRGGIPFLSHAVAAILLGALGITIFFQRRGVEKNSKSSRPTWPEIFLILYIAWFIFSLIFSEVPHYGFTELLSLCIGFLIFTMVSRGIFSSLSTRHISLVFLSLFGLSLLIGVFTYIFLPFDRFTGPFLNFQKLYEAYPNDFASFVLLLMPFALFLAIKGEGLIKKAAIFLSGLTLAALFLTLSRGAWLTFFVALLFASLIIFIQKWPFHFSKLFYSQSLRRLLGTILLTAIVSTGVLMLARSQYEKLARLTDRFSGYEGGSGIHDRLEFWDASLKMMIHNPVFGRGPVAFKFIFPRYQKTFGILQDQPHNFYLKTAMENGIPALLFFLGFIGILFFISLRVLKHSKDPLLFTAVIAASTVLFQNFIDDTLNFVSNGIIFWGLLGYIFLRVKEHFRRLRFPSIAWIPAVLILLILPLTLYEFWFNIHFKKAKSLLAAGKFIEAEAKFEQSKKLYFERDLRDHLSNFYEKKYEATKNPEVLGTWMRMAFKGMKEEPHNAEIYFSAGKASYLRGHKGPASVYFKRAFDRDDKNFLKYHYYYYLSQAELSRPIDSQKIQKLLHRYRRLLQKNAHFTVATENPFYAAKLYELLFAHAPEADKKTIETDFLVYQSVWKKEREKFEKLYGIHE